MTSAYNVAISILSRRDYSRLKLKQKLITRGFEEEEIESAIEKLKENKLFNEDNYINAKVRGHLRRGYTPSWIVSKLELEQISISESYVNEIMEEIEITLADIFLTHLNKKDVKNERDKTIRFLLSKGFTAEQVHQGLKTLE